MSKKLNISISKSEKGYVITKSDADEFVIPVKNDIHEFVEKVAESYDKNSDEEWEKKTVLYPNVDNPRYAIIITRKRKEP
mgnify:CR=1 FL=1